MNWIGAPASGCREIPMSSSPAAIFRQLSSVRSRAPTITRVGTVMMPFDVTARWIERDGSAKFMLCVPHEAVAADGGESERTTSSKSDDQDTPCIDELALDQQVQASIGIPGEFRSAPNRDKSFDRECREP